MPQCPSTFTDAVLAWLADRQHPLSEASRRTYRGEVDRLATFVAARDRTIYLNDLREHQWLNYLDAMSDDRTDIASRRKDVLATRSLAQARRITSNFLRWAFARKIIDWHPPPTTSDRDLRAPLVNRALAPPQKASSHVSQALQLPPPTGLSLREIRSRLVLHLAYWMGLKCTEIANLKVRHIKASRAALQVHAEKLVGPLPSAPQATAQLWKMYLAERTKSLGPVSLGEPLICDLRGSGAVTAWTIWAVLREWGESDASPVTARGLRRFALARLAERIVGELDDISAYARCDYIDYRVAVRES